jgi:hypothetical protein
MVHDAMKKEVFYVAASRGRESVTVVTSDPELLRESVARSGARQSASELARKVQPRTPARRSTPPFGGSPARPRTGDPIRTARAKGRGDTRTESRGDA